MSRLRWIVPTILLVLAVFASTPVEAQMSCEDYYACLSDCGNAYGECLEDCQSPDRQQASPAGCIQVCKWAQTSCKQGCGSTPQCFPEASEPPPVEVASGDLTLPPDLEELEAYIFDASTVVSCDTSLQNVVGASESEEPPKKLSCTTYTYTERFPECIRWRCTDCQLEDGSGNVIWADRNCSGSPCNQEV